MKDTHKILKERNRKKLKLIKKSEDLDYWSMLLLIMLIVIFVVAVLDLMD